MEGIGVSLQDLPQQWPCAYPQVRLLSASLGPCVHTTGSVFMYMYMYMSSRPERGGRGGMRKP